MATVITTAVTAAGKVTARQDHQAVLEIEIKAFDKCLGVFFGDLITAVLHIKRETPYFLRHLELANR